MTLQRRKASLDKDSLEQKNLSVVGSDIMVQTYNFVLGNLVLKLIVAILP